MKTFKEYADAAAKTAQYPKVNPNCGLYYCTLGLAGEAGEIANKLKKAIRDDNGEVSEKRRQATIDELGDVLWYVTGVARELNTSLEEVAKRNIEKLFRRVETDTIKGDGDNR